LAALFQNRRVFRHLTLGNMPDYQERDSWLLSDDGRGLTLVCERGDPGFEAESGRPGPRRWHLVASASFAAMDSPPGQAWAPHYRREQLIVARAGPTTCVEVGDRLDLACRPNSLDVLQPDAYVPIETPNPDNGGSLRWFPSARRHVAGLYCRATSALNPSYEFPFYDLEAPPGQPMLFFADGAVERVIHSGGLQYSDFREALITPLDARLPPEAPGKVP